MVVNVKFNLPGDVLCAILVQCIENGPTGAEPKDMWCQIVSHITNAVVEWVNGELKSIFGGLESAVDMMDKDLEDVYRDFIMAVYDNDTGKAAVEFIKIFALIGAIGITIYGLYWGLSVAVNADPVVGLIITGLVTAAFMVVFYALYPEEYRAAGRR